MGIDGDKDLSTDSDTERNAQAVDPSLGKRVVRKLDKHLLSLLCVLYLLAFLDRSNVGNAKVAGMSDDLSLQGDKYEWLLTIFYIAYIVSAPLILCWRTFPPHMWCAFVVFGWGAVATVQAGTSNWAGMMVCRFLLGVFEQGFGPGVPYLFSFFYMRREIGFRSGIFTAMAPLATCFAGALAYGITSGRAAIASWRLLFLVEGLPVIPMALVVYFFLPDGPSQARFFTAEEKQIVLARTMRQAPGLELENDGRRAINWRQTVAGFADLKQWLTALMYFSCNVSFSSLPVFLPTILEEMGFSGINAQGLSAPPYALSFLVTLATTWLADRTQQRGATIMLMTALGGVGYIMLAASTSVSVRYAGVYVAAAGIFPAIANILPWVSNNQGNDSRRGAGFVMLSLIGQCGPLLGTRIYPSHSGPRFVTGHGICAGFLFFTTLLAFSLRLLLIRENRKLDREYGTLGEQRSRAASAAVGSSVDDAKHEKLEEGLENHGPMYRFVL